MCTQGEETEVIECYMGTHYTPISCPLGLLSKKNRWKRAPAHSSRRVNIRIHTQMCTQVQGREHKGSKAGRKINTNGRIIGSIHTLFSTHG